MRGVWRKGCFSLRLSGFASEKKVTQRRRDAKGGILGAVFSCQEQDLKYKRMYLISVIKGSNGFLVTGG